MYICVIYIVKKPCKKPKINTLLKFPKDFRMLLMDEVG